MPAPTGKGAMARRRSAAKGKRLFCIAYGMHNDNKLSTQPSGADNLLKFVLPFAVMDSMHTRLCALSRKCDRFQAKYAVHADDKLTVTEKVDVTLR